MRVSRWLADFASARLHRSDGLRLGQGGLGGGDMQVLNDLSIDNSHALPAGLGLFKSGDLTAGEVDLGLGGGEGGLAGEGVAVLVKETAFAGVGVVKSGPEND